MEVLHYFRFFLQFLFFLFLLFIVNCSHFFFSVRRRERLLPCRPLAGVDLLVRVAHFPQSAVHHRSVVSRAQQITVITQMTRSLHTCRPHFTARFYTNSGLIRMDLQFSQKTPKDILGHALMDSLFTIRFFFLSVSPPFSFYLFVSVSILLSKCECSATLNYI